MGFAMVPQLIAVTDGPNIPLNKPILLVGRHQECDIQVPSRKISRRHCCLAQVGQTLVVRDLGSTNGIRVNGTRLLEGQLHDGDELTIGNLRYQFRLTTANPAPLETGGHLLVEAPQVKKEHTPYRLAENLDLLPLDAPPKVHG